MSKFPLDLSKFSKVSVDEDVATLSHPHGHEIKIAVKALTPKLREQLHALPEAKKKVKMDNGGEVPQPKPEPTGDDIKDAIKKSFGFGKQEPVQKAHGGEIKQNYAEGDIVLPVDGQAPALPEHLAGPTNPSSIIDQEALATAANKQRAEQIIWAQDKGSAYGVPGAESIGQDPRSEAEKFLAASNAAPTEMVAEPQATTPAAEPVQQPMAAKPEAAMEIPNIASGYAQELQGIQQEARAQGHLANEQAKVRQAAIAKQEEQLNHFEDATKTLNAERENFIKDINNNHIDPTKYWQNHSKVASAIGIILAGFNPRGGPNAAIELLNHQMAQNLEAQAKNLDSKNNLLNANLHQFGNIRDAMQMTKIMQSDMVANQLDLEATKATDPMVKARALKLSGELKSKMAPEFMNFAMRRAELGMMNAQAGEGGAPQTAQQVDQYMRTLRVANPEKYKLYEQAYVPGEGISSRPVNDKVRDTILAKKQLDERANDLYKWAEKNSGSVDLKTIAAGKTKAAELQSMYRNAIDGGVFKPGEQTFIEKIINSDPAAFFNKIRVLPALKEVIKSNNAQLNTLRRSAGLPAQNSESSSSLTPAQQSLVRQARAHPENAKAQMYLKKLGLD